MGTYLPPGVCKNELQKAKDAVDDLNEAYEDYLAAKSNTEAGMWGSGAGLLTMLGCAASSLTGVGLIICLGAGGAGVVSGGLWTASGVPDLKDSVDDLNDAIDEAEDAIDALCDCFNSNATSVPD